MQIKDWPWTKVVRSTLKNHSHSAKKQLVQTKPQNKAPPTADALCRLTFGSQVPVERAVLCKPSPALVTLEGLFPRVVADVADQRALFPKAPAAVLADVGLILQVRTEMNLLGILHKGRSKGRAAKGNDKLRQAVFTFWGKNQQL